MIARNLLVVAVRHISFCWVVIYGFAAYANDYSQDLPSIPGEFVDVGTHRLHYRCVGQGIPTVVVDNGIAGSATEWYEIQAKLAERYRVCVYDRAGYAWSEPGPSPRTTNQIAEELRALIVEAQEPGPFIFVGHSFGGFTAIRMAAMMGDQVQGIVLVDSSSPHVLFNHDRSDEILRNPIAVGAATGNDTVPGTPQEMAKFLNSRRKALFVQMDEIANFEASAGQVADVSTLSTLPMLVVARDLNALQGAEARESTWREAQVALSKISRQGQLLIADGSDHFIHLRKPAWLAEKMMTFIEALK